MAIGPYEAGLSPSQREFVDRIDRLVTEELMRTWPMNQLAGSIEVPIPPQEFELGFPERHALCERYRIVGWYRASVVGTWEYYSLKLERGG